jgi:hypothetical protein
LVDTAAAKMPDARWTVAIFDEHPLVRTRAIHLFARATPTACATTVAGVRAIKSSSRGVYLGSLEDRAIHDGLLATSVLGDACAAEMEALVRDASLPRQTRGTALQVLAMMRAPSADALARDLGEDFRDHVGRAREIAALR